MTARPLPETSGAWYPFWSPDGSHIAFFADGKLKRIDLRGGSPQVIADAPSGRGGSWGKGDVILFSPNVRSAIHQVPATGGTPAPVTRFDPEKETTHRWPYFLPDGKHFLYLLRARVSGKPEVGRLMLASTDSAETQLLIDDSTNAVYVEPGYLLYGRSGNLNAWRFDAGKPAPDRPAGSGRQGEAELLGGEEPRRALGVELGDPRVPARGGAEDHAAVVRLRRPGTRHARRAWLLCRAPNLPRRQEGRLRALRAHRDAKRPLDHGPPVRAHVPPHAEERPLLPCPSGRATRRG